jgi:hypothetical protein
MSWSLLVPLIVQYGLPFVESLFQKWTSGTAPTAQDFADLRALASKNATDILTTQLTAAGIPLTDPKAVALLALVK